MFLYIQASSSNNNKVISFTGRRVGTGIPVYAENRIYSRLLSPTMRQQQWILQQCCDDLNTAVISWCVLRLRLWSRAVNIGHGGLSQIIWVCCVSGNISLPSLPADMLCAFRPILYPVVSSYNYHLRQCIYSLVPDLLIGVSNFQQKQGLMPPGKCSSRDFDFNYFVENLNLRGSNPPTYCDLMTYCTYLSTEWRED